MCSFFFLGQDLHVVDPLFIQFGQFISLTPDYYKTLDSSISRRWGEW